MPSTYEPIATTTLGSSTANIDFTSIPSTYTDLVVVGLLKTATATGNATYMRFNGDTGSNYSATDLSGTGTATVTTRFANQTWIRLNYYSDPNTSLFTPFLLNIMNYSNTTSHKNTISNFARADSAGQIGFDYMAGLWRSSAQINQITVFIENSTNLAAGSSITLYGVKAA
jgi:hypothetical protein